MGINAIVRGISDPISCATQKRRMVGVLGMTEPRQATYRLWLACRNSACRCEAEARSGLLANANTSSTWRTRVGRNLRPTTMLLALDDYGDSAAYAGALKAQTGGNLGREVRKAQRLGYLCRTIDPQHHRDGIDAIIRSMPIRAYGPVLRAFSGRHRPTGGDTGSPVRAVCDEHWERSWGVFRANGQGETLAAYATLYRAGDVVFLREFMGHGDALRDAVTKLLLCEIVSWLLDAPDLAARGVRYLRYGSLEFGNLGLLSWKKAFKFAPTLVDRDPGTVATLPQDFDPKLYLRLYPDIAASGLDPRLHWLRSGVHEGRPYR